MKLKKLTIFFLLLIILTGNSVWAKDRKGDYKFEINKIERKSDNTYVVYLGYNNEGDKREFPSHIKVQGDIIKISKMPRDMESGSKKYVFYVVFKSNSIKLLYKDSFLTKYKELVAYSTKYSLVNSKEEFSIKDVHCNGYPFSI